MLNPLQMLLLGQDPNDPAQAYWRQTQFNGPQAAAPMQPQQPPADMKQADTGSLLTAPIQPVVQQQAQQSQQSMQDLISPADRQQALFSNLTKLGAALIGAGGHMTSGERSKMIAQGVAGMGDMQSDALNSAQKRLVMSHLQGQMQDEQRKRQALQSLQGQIGNQDFIQSIGLTPQQAAVLGPEGIQQVIAHRAQQDPNDVAYKKALTDEAIARTEAAKAKPAKNYTFHTAQDGTVYRMSPEGGDVEVAFRPEVKDLLDGLAGGQQQQAPASNQMEFGGNPANAFGVSGAFAGPWASLKGMVGGQPLTGEQKETLGTQTAINNFNDTLINHVATDLKSGRQSARALQLAQQDVPKPGDFTMSPEKALAKYKGFYTMLDRQLDDARNEYQSAVSQRRPDAARKAIDFYKQTQAVKQQLDELTAGLGANVGGRAYAPGAQSGRSAIGGDALSIADRVLGGGK